MNTIPLLLACLLLLDRVCAEQVELNVGEEVSAAAQGQLQRLPVMSSGGEILNHRSDPCIMIDRTEYLKETTGLVIAIEVTRDSWTKGGRPTLTKLSCSNEGGRKLHQ